MNTETDFPGAAEEFKGDGGFLPAGGFAHLGQYQQWLEVRLSGMGTVVGIGTIQP